jgi:adenylate cyclase
MKSNTNEIRIRVFFGTLLALLLICSPFFLDQRLDDLERYSIDRRFELRGALPPDPDLIIIGIDHETMISEQRPLTFMNPVFAELLQGLATAGARAVFLDLIYDSRYDPAIRDMVKSHLTKNDINIPRHIINRMGFDVPLIEACVEARDKGLKIVLGYFSDKEASGGLLQVFRVSEKAFVNATLDPDSVWRRAILFGRNTGEGTARPSAAVSLAGFHCGSPWVVSEDNTLRIGSQTISTLHRHREGQINFRGPRGTFPMLPLHQVLQTIRTSSPDLKKFHGKTFLVGLHTIEDVRTSPFGSIQGVEVHANITDNLIHNRFLQEIPRFWSRCAILVFLILQLAAFSHRLKSAVILTGLLLISWWTGAFFAFHQGVLVEIVRPTLFLALFGFLEAFRILYKRRKEVRQVRQLFSRYVNDTVIGALLNQSWEQALQGKRRRICVMVIDIRGFTTLSEALDPHIIVEFLNRYFSRVTTIIMSHGGMIDKFLGDGVLAIFNAPLDQPGFPKASVLAAQEIVKAISHEAIQSGDRSFSPKIGIGLHIGEAIVGNIGSEKKMEYTAIGDTVNTASRIEGLNKELGTTIIASETLFQETRMDFPWQDLGEHKLRGREKPMHLYTIRNGNEE